MRLTDDQIKMARVTYTKVVQDDFILDLIDTIEALQQENEQLKEQINTARIGCDTHKTYSEQLEQQTVELLRKARKALHEGISELKVHCEYYNQTPEEDACIEMHEAIVAIDKALGGKEDGKPI